MPPLEKSTIVPIDEPGSISPVSMSCRLTDAVNSVLMRRLLKINDAIFIATLRVLNTPLICLLYRV